MFNEENKTFKFERHVSATPVPLSVYGRNYNDVQYIAENLNNNSMIQQLITKKDWDLHETIVDLGKVSPSEYALPPWFLIMSVLLLDLWQQNTRSNKVSDT